MRRVLQFIAKGLLLTAGMLMLTGAVSFAQSSVVVDPGLNTIQAAMLANPGDTLILQKGNEYVVSSPVEITQPTVIRGEAYARDGSGDPPAVMRGSADPGTEGDFFMFLAAADLTLIDLGFIGFTWDNKQIEGIVGISKSFLDFEVSGCIWQSCNKTLVTNGFAGSDFLLHDNVHYNLGTTGWDNYSGWGGPAYRGDSTTNHTYNCTYFVGGRMMLTGSSGPYGWQQADHCTYVNNWGETFHKSKTDGYKVENSIFFNSHLRGYVGERVWMDGADTALYWGGDYVSYRQLGDTLNGDCAVFPSAKDTVDAPNEERFVVITHNLKYNEQRVTDWHTANNVSTQPFMAWAMRERAAEHGWTIAPNWTPDADDSNTGYDPQFEMGEIPQGAFDGAWAQRLDRMDPEIPDHEVAWRPEGSEQKDFIWPLPFDFTPMNEDVHRAGSDGFPLGDLNWYPPAVKAAWLAGEDNPVGIIEKVEKLNMKLVNYPNPFSLTTRIRYELPGSNHVTMKIYNMAGAEVATLVNETQFAGQHEMMFDGANLAGGVYFCHLKTGNLVQVHKMTLIK